MEPYIGFMRTHSGVFVKTVVGGLSWTKISQSPIEAERVALIGGSRKTFLRLGSGSNSSFRPDEDETTELGLIRRGLSVGHFFQVAEEWVFGTYRRVKLFSNLKVLPATLPAL